MSRLERQFIKSGRDPLFLCQCAAAALAEARARHPQPFVCANHALGVFEEEYHELRVEIFKRQPDPQRLQEEALQCIAVLLRLIEDVTFKPKCQRK